MADYKRITECSICLCTYSDPRMLQCQHTFCRACVTNLAQTTSTKSTFSCPICRREYKVSEAGGLPPNIFINSLLNCVEQKPKRHKDGDLKRNITTTPQGERGGMKPTIAPKPPKNVIRKVMSHLKEDASPTKKEDELPTEREDALPTKREDELPTKREDASPTKREDELQQRTEEITASISNEEETIQPSTSTKVETRKKEPHVIYINATEGDGETAAEQLKRKGRNHINSIHEIEETDLCRKKSMMLEAAEKTYNKYLTKLREAEKSALDALHRGPDKQLEQRRNDRTELLQAIEKQCEQHVADNDMAREKALQKADDGLEEAIASIKSASLTMAGWTDEDDKEIRTTLQEKYDKNVEKAHTAHSKRLVGNQEAKKEASALVEERFKDYTAQIERERAEQMTEIGGQIARQLAEIEAAHAEEIENLDKEFAESFSQLSDATASQMKQLEKEIILVQAKEHMG